MSIFNAQFPRRIERLYIFNIMETDKHIPSNLEILWIFFFTILKFYTCRQHIIDFLSHGHEFYQTEQLKQ